ncbi:MAG: ABC transporter permease subunit [Candidatus Adiutrix sp.]|jgi:NitT/TauT family transport system permease protein|nr:ABC transporter permease subunit [Candidatus Adiutrix sp.]
MSPNANHFKPANKTKPPTGLFGALVIFAGLILLYSLATDVTGWLDPMIFPGWKSIGPAGYASAWQLLQGLLSSLGLLLPSVGLATLLGVILGVTIGLRPRAQLVLAPLFNAMNSIPPTMLIPYAIAVLPTFWISSAAIIFIGVFWPVLMSTLLGIALLEPRWLDNARCLNLKGRRLIFKVVLRGSMPQICAGVRTGLIRSFVLLTVAEMFGTDSGMGYFVQYYSDYAKYDRVICGMLFLSFVVVALMSLFGHIQNRLLYWTKKR